MDIQLMPKMPVKLLQGLARILMESLLCLFGTMAIFLVCVLVTALIPHTGEGKFLSQFGFLLLGIFLFISIFGIARISGFRYVSWLVAGAYAQAIVCNYVGEYYNTFWELTLPTVLPIVAGATAGTLLKRYQTPPCQKSELAPKPQG
jgi:hypothetical protein